MSSKVIGWECIQVIEIPFFNFNFGGHEPAEALQLVREGKKRWICGPGRCLTLVDPNYGLGPWDTLIAVSEYEKLESASIFKKGPLNDA